MCKIQAEICVNECKLIFNFLEFIVWWTSEGWPFQLPLDELCAQYTPWWTIDRPNCEWKFKRFSVLKATKLNHHNQIDWWLCKRLFGKSAARSYIRRILNQFRGTNSGQKLFKADCCSFNITLQRVHRQQIKPHTYTVTVVEICRRFRHTPQQWFVSRLSLGTFL